MILLTSNGMVHYFLKNGNWCCFGFACVCFFSYHKLNLNVTKGLGRIMNEIITIKNIYIQMF